MGARLVFSSAGYLVCSLTMSVFNSYLLNKDRYNFRFPLFAATAYDVVQFVLAAVILRWTTSGPGDGPVAMMRRLSRKQFWCAIVPCAVAAGLDIALSNYALRHVTLSFYTMVKSSAPMFVLMCATALGVERASWRLAAIVAVIGAGTVLTVWNEFQFNLLGFALLFGASLMSGLRWSLTQLIIEHESRRGDGHLPAGPVATILYLAPVVGAVLGGLSMAIEGPLAVPRSPMFASAAGVGALVAICLAGGVISFLLILVEYSVVEQSSVVTFSIMGIVKELVTIGTSVALFGDRLTLVNWLGAGVSIAGIGLYHLYRSGRRRKLLTASQEEMVREQTATATALFMVVPASEPMPMFNPFYDRSDDDDTPSDNVDAAALLVVRHREDEDAIRLHHSYSSLSTSLLDMTNPAMGFERALGCPHHQSLPRNIDSNKKLYKNSSLSLVHDGHLEPNGKRQAFEH